jgi:hypothetical protein
MILFLLWSSVDPVQSWVLSKFVFDASSSFSSLDQMEKDFVFSSWPEVTLSRSWRAEIFFGELLTVWSFSLE